MKYDKSCLRSSLVLYAVTDRMWIDISVHKQSAKEKPAGSSVLITQIEEALRGGAGIIQLREKNLPAEEFISLAKRVKTVTDLYNVPLIINDDVETALAVNAAGVHVGQSDCSAADVRSRIGTDKILGVSVTTAEQAVKAVKDGADYLGAGAVFTTSTKTDADSVPLDVLRSICSTVSVPVVAIGGITEKNILQLSGSGCAGAAVVSALFASNDVYRAARILHALSAQAAGIT